jgi:MSHA biogenesis protein MshJ
MTNPMAAKFNGLNKRERLLITVTIIVLTIVLFFMFAIEPLMKTSSKLYAQIEQQERMTSGQTIQIEAFSKALSLDPSAAVRLEIAKLDVLDQSLTILLQKRSVNLMGPLQMSKVLETVLQDNRGITLQRLSSLPLQPLHLSSESEPNSTSVSTPASDTSSALSAAPVYSHGFEVVLRGGYSDIYDYLRRLEGLSSSFFWDSLEYKVVNYPDSEMTLRVHTLSAVEGWLGG